MILTSTMIAAAATFLTNQLILKSKGFETARDEISLETWNWIKKIFIKENKEKVIEKVEQDPEKYKSALEVAIEEVAEKNPDFDKKLAEFVKEEEKKGENSSINIQGNNNKVYQNVKGNITDNSTNQTHTGTGDNIGRDKIIGK